MLYGNVSPLAGTYDIIVYSLGTEATRVEGTASRAGANAFTSQLGITIKAKNSDKGKIEIEYFTKEELERIMELIYSINN